MFESSAVWNSFSAESAFRLFSGFGARHVLRHIGRGEIQAGGRQIGIEIDRRLESVSRLCVLARFESIDALVQVVARFQLVASGAE